MSPRNHEDRAGMACGTLAPFGFPCLQHGRNWTPTPFPKCPSGSETASAGCWVTCCHSGLCLGCHISWSLLRSAQQQYQSCPNWISVYPVARHTGVDKPFPIPGRLVRPSAAWKPLLPGPLSGPPRSPARLATLGGPWRQGRARWAGRALPSQSLSLTLQVTI